MRIKELLHGLTLAEDVGPGRPWDPHTLGAPGSVPPFVPGNRGPGVPDPMAPAAPMPMQRTGQVGPGRPWDPHTLGAPGSVPPFVPGNRDPGPVAPIAPEGPIPMQPGKVALGGGPGPMPGGTSAPTNQAPKIA